MGQHHAPEDLEDDELQAAVDGVTADYRWKVAAIGFAALSFLASTTDLVDIVRATPGQVVQAIEQLDASIVTDEEERTCNPPVTVVNGVSVASPIPFGCPAVVLKGPGDPPALYCVPWQSSGALECTHTPPSSAGNLDSVGP